MIRMGYLVGHNQLDLHFAKGVASMLMLISWFYIYFTQRRILTRYAQLPNATYSHWSSAMLTAITADATFGITYFLSLVVLNRIVS